MTIESIFFYGITISDGDSAWRQLQEKWEDDLGVVNTEEMLVQRFHADLLEQKQWKKRFKYWGGDYLRCLLSELPPEEVFGGCRLNAYGDRRKFAPAYYVATYEAELMSRIVDTQIDPKLVNRPPRNKWNSRLKRFCKQLGIEFREPGWKLAFWWC